MQRRHFISGLGATLPLLPLTLQAQQTAKIYRVGYLAVGAREQQLHLISAFEDGLRNYGYRPGENVQIEFRFAAGQPERLPPLAQELVGLNVDVILVSNNANAAAALQATRRIPIVMAASTDPVGAGLVESLARPGGNVTGYTQDAGGHEIEGKRLEFLKAATPNLSRLGVLFNPNFVSTQSRLALVGESARQLALTLVPAPVSDLQALEPAFAKMVDGQVEGILVLGDPVMFNLRSQIAALAARSRLPSISTGRDFAEAGLLLAYGVDFKKTFKSVATVVDKIFKGARPADLPIEQPTNFEFIVNIKTARLLGLSIPPSLLAQADEVLE